MKFVGRIIISAIALFLSSLILPGMHLAAEGSTTSRIVTVVLVALVFAIVNTVIKPVLSFLSLPLTCLTLGLFTLVINAIMLLLTAWLSQLFGLAFHIDSFWWAVLAGVLVGLLVSIFEGLVGLHESREGR
ncbi:phage holin family protein [Devriesea agamarum]|uniref:phage holin family protein n=1 Tax=Devriesea agamarum TaxID=472569 RepID=UPI00071D434C|nr:phage holin family protein [Devriesea agamarum]